VYSNYYNPDFYRDFCLIADQLPHLKAICYIRELWNHPDIPISATRLYCLYNSPDHPSPEISGDELDYSYSECDCYYPPELPIPICDHTTLQQLRKEVSRLYSQLQTARQNNDLARAEECKASLEQISDYLKSSISSRGKLFYLSNLEHTHSLLILRSVQRLYRIMQPYNTELVSFLRQHVVIGVRCQWSDLPIPRKGKQEKA